MEVAVYYLIFLVGLFLSLFTLFALSKNDFVLLRRGVSMPLIYDNCFIALAVGLVASRIVFIVDSFSFTYFNPIQFVHIFLYPGFSLFGFYLGFFGVITYFFVKKKAFARAFDLYATSFMFVFISYVAYMLIAYGHYVYLGIHGVATLLVFVVMVHFYRHFTLKDGNSGIFALFYLSLSYLVMSFWNPRGELLYSLSLTQIISAVVMVVSLGFFIFRQFISKK